MPLPIAGVIIGTEAHEEPMKKISARKHGYNARKALIERWISLPGKSSQVTFESSSQSYCWTTERSRARLIKH
jgi:hypothetical protein